MNTAYLGNNSSRRGSPIKFILAALAMTLLPVGVAAAQQPATPEAPPVVEAPATPAPDVAAPPADAAAAPADDEESLLDVHIDDDRLHGRRRILRQLPPNAGKAEDSCGR